MKVLVTGALGSIGRATVARLIRHGHEALALDRLAETDVDQDVWDAVKGAEYRQVDTRDFDSLTPHFAGSDAVIHLAAIPHPSMGTEVEVFDTNCRGAFNVYRAAADAGIKRVVSASSINALGYGMGVKGFPIRYLPMDEEHPMMTSDPYSFSKQMLEETAAYFWRREGISGVSIRFPFVLYPTSHWAERVKQFLSFRLQAVDELMALPETERRARIDPLVAEAEAERAERPQEIPWAERRRQHETREGKRRGPRRGPPRPGDAPPPPERMLMFGRRDFWSIIHGENAAQALELGVTADYEGSHPLYVSDRHNSVGGSSQQLVELFYPEVTTWKRPVTGSETLLSYDRARELIGYEPEESLLAWSAEG